MKLDKKRVVAVYKRNGIVDYFCAGGCQLSQNYGVDPRSVYAWIIGEHGLLLDLPKG